MKVWKNSVKGQKSQNEDFILYNKIGDGKHLCLIADGMGGYYNGKNTAELVGVNISVFLENQQVINEHVIQIAINKANLLLRQALQNGAEKAGATVGGVYVDNRSAIIFWVGDVKIYYLKKGSLQFESREHSIITHLIDRGIIIDSRKASRYKHIVTRAVLGDTSNSSAAFYKISKVDDEDIFIICSDGFQSRHLVALDLPKEIYHTLMSVILRDDEKNDDSSIVVFSLM